MKSHIQGLDGVSHSDDFFLRENQRVYLGLNALKISALKAERDSYHFPQR